MQNFRWAFSVQVLSHFVKSPIVYAPHTSELYSNIGEITLSKILQASFGGSWCKSICLRILYRACIAFSLSCWLAISNFVLGVNFKPRYVYSLVMEIGLDVFWFRFMFLQNHDFRFFEVDFQ